MYVFQHMRETVKSFIASILSPVRADYIRSLRLGTVRRNIFSLKTLRMPRFVQIQLIFTLFLIAFAKQLPDSVIPVEYKLDLITNLGDEDDSFNFRGSITIEMRCVSPTDNIILHSKDLKIDNEKTMLKCLNETEDLPSVSETSLDPENDFLIIKLSQTLQADHHYEMELLYEGDLGEDKVGYYRGSYLDDNEWSVWFGVTYFKPNHARRAFPCFDELTFKAKFTINLGRSTKYKSISNMPLSKTQPMEDKLGWEWDSFQTSPPMSTYVVGFALITYQSQDIQADRNPVKVALSIWGAEDIINSEFTYRAIEFSAYFLHIFETNLKMPYPLPKLDMIAIPNYPVSTMECWGLIIWEENYLVKVTMATLGFNSEFLGIVADQIVRQIFGNVVTIKSWSDLWFVDGFGAYIAPFVVDNAERGYGWMNSEITDNILSLFHFDSFKKSLAVSNPSNQVDSIDTIVDSNTAKKTSLLVRMMSHFVGNRNLHYIIQEYLTVYKYKNAGSEELLELVDKNSSYRYVPAKTVMKTWTTQAGFPVITVTRDYKHGKLEVKQERFFNDYELLGTDSTRWWIPLTYTTECERDFNNTMPRKWFPANKDSVTMRSPPSPADWIIFNVDASGPYLVNYDERNWELIIDFLHKPFFQKIPPLNRVLLIESAARLAGVGRLDYRIFLDVLKYISSDDEVQPLYSAINRVYDLNILLKRMPIHQEFRSLMTAIFQRKVKLNMNIKNEMTKSMIKNGRMIGGSCNHDREDCEMEVVRPQRRSMMTYILKSLDYLMEVLCSDKATKEYPWRVYMDSKEIPIRRLEMTLSLTCSKNRTLLGEYLDGCVNEKDLRPEEIVPIIVAVTKSTVGYDLVTEFISKNIKTIHDRISPNFHELSRVIFQLGRHTIAEDEVTWLRNFIDTNQEYLQNIQGSIDEALEIARLNVQWHSKIYDKIAVHFRESTEDD